MGCLPQDNACVFTTTAVRYALSFKKGGDTMTKEVRKGFCKCGCGQKTAINKQSSVKDGLVKGEPKRFISGHNSRTGALSISWKGGRIKSTHGYICVKNPNHPKAMGSGYVYEHIVVAERTAGRSMLPGEVVHHLNGVKSDNRPENLKICRDQKEHFLIHQRQRAERECGNPELRQCTFCKKWDIPNNLNRLNGSPYHKECAKRESKRRYDAGLCKRDQEKVNAYTREKRAERRAKGLGGVVPVLAVYLEVTARDNGMI